jgi:hypothetical protein
MLKEQRRIKRINLLWKINSKILFLIEREYNRHRNNERKKAAGKMKIK